uniref:Lipocalin/cytosolic fatty-acid binding domain-containing protein n=1 Tax=Acrobeloides nanus TaxID=290746 RepID=A0A914DW57_9BILA
MAEKFVGKWNFVESENIDDFMKQVGVSLALRTIVAKLKPVLEVTVNGNHCKLVSTSTFKTIVTEFELGVEFDEETPFGPKMKTTFTLENGKLIKVQNPVSAGDKATRTESYVEGDNFIMEMECEGVKAKRIFTRA